MQFHELKTYISRKPKKRVGRGGKRGTYSGRGIKGQKARAGRKFRPEIIEMVKKIPKLRGIKNKKSLTKVIIKTKELMRYSRNFQITPKILRSKGLKKAKIIAGGPVNGAFTVRSIMISKGARDMVERAGGKVLQ